MPAVFVPLLVLALAPVAAPAADAGARVPATELVAKAESSLRAAVATLGVEATFAQAGRVLDVHLAADGAYELRVAPLAGAWLRPRVAVPVEVHVGGRRVSTANLWFAVSAPVPSPVYAGDYARGAIADNVRAVDGTADLARTHGERAPSLDTLAGLRLRKPVKAGQPLLASDFEPAPAVQAQQPVRIESRHGAIVLQTTGRALADADVGELVAVLPSQGERPVRARVVSPQAVLLED
jgi:flagella basal body P-ring formation protein FlgA